MEKLLQMGDDLWLAVDPCDLPDMEVGSSLLGLYVDVSHANTIHGEVLHAFPKGKKRWRETEPILNYTGGSFQESAFDWYSIQYT